MADICGHAMEVPEANLNLSGENFPSRAPYGWAAGAADHEARMSIPGAAMSGCRQRLCLVAYNTNINKKM